MSLPETILSHTYDNGLILAAQPMPWLDSAAVTIAVPGGCRFDPADQFGLANFVCEMVQRGCGDYSSRQFIESLELLGVDFGSSVSNYVTTYRGAMPAGQLLGALDIFCDLLRKPHLPENQLEDGRLVCIQEIKGLEDDLSQRVINELGLRFFGRPDGNWSEGNLESITAVNMDDIRRYYERHYSPNGTIIAVAGKIDWESLQRKVGFLFGDWTPAAAVTLDESEPQHGSFHIPFDSEQTHIGVAFPSVCYSDPDYYLCRGAVGVLSGGFSSRLFAEIREKRGLCYTVYASCHSLRDKGGVIAYSGTSTDRAQETLDVLLEQLQNLELGIREDELQRLKIQLRTSLVAQQESCRSRASSIASDWFHLGRARTLSEVNEIIQSLQVESINRYLADHKPSYFDVVTLGGEPLRTYGISKTST